MTTVRDELTVREREIAQLVACGRRNAEIAAELRIARRTVEWKLTRIYRKLGVRSKVGLAAQIATGESLLAAVERHATEANAQETWRWGPSLDDLTRPGRRARPPGGDDRAVARDATRRMTRLTPTERRVAELVATGATNDEVAAELGMSPKTVETHLTRTTASSASAPARSWRSCWRAVGISPRPIGPCAKCNF